MEMAPVIVLSMPGCKKYQLLYHIQRERPFCKGGGNLALWLVGVVAESNIESDTAPGLGKVTIGLMGKRAIMSSHGGGKKTPLSHSYSLPNVKVKGTRQE